MRFNEETFNHVYPIRRINVYQGGVVEVKRTCLLQSQLLEKKPRGRIKTLSTSSLTRLAFTVLATSVRLKSLLTLTYLSSPIDLREAKKDLHRFVTKMQRYYGQFSYVWFMEFTKVGLAHFHILASVEAHLISRTRFAFCWLDACKAKHYAYSSRRTKKWDTVRNAMLKVHSHKACIQAIRVEDGARRYALKYCLKPYQKKVPSYISLTGRFWGASQDIKPVPEVSDVDITEDELREKMGAGHRLAGKDILPKFIFM